jgi:cytochrome c oxidase cbb3-type subunit 4
MTGGIITLALLLLFVGGWIWIWQPSHKAEFDAAAQLPLEDDSEEPRE